MSFDSSGLSLKIALDRCLVDFEEYKGRVRACASFLPSLLSVEFMERCHASFMHCQTKIEELQRRLINQYGSPEEAKKQPIYNQTVNLLDELQKAHSNLLSKTEQASSRGLSTLQTSSASAPTSFRWSSELRPASPWVDPSPTQPSTKPSSSTDLP